MVDPRECRRSINRSWGFQRPYETLACQNHSSIRHQPDPVFHLLTCLELYEGVLGLPATLIPLNEQRQVVCQAQGSLRVVLGLSRYSVLFTAIERSDRPVRIDQTDRSQGSPRCDKRAKPTVISDRSATVWPIRASAGARLFDPRDFSDHTKLSLTKTIALSGIRQIQFFIS